MSQITRLVTTVLLLNSAVLFSAGKSSADAQTRSTVLRAPLGFEINSGQSDPDVKFLSRGDGFALFLTRDAAVFELRKAAGANESPGVIGMHLAGASADTQATPEQPLPGTVNYFIGNDPSKWRAGTTAFGRIRYRSVYPGIDLVYYGTQRELEYDFVLAPGADPRRIELAFTGARPRLRADGGILLALDGGEVAFHKPVIYQRSGTSKEFVDGGFALDGDQVRFHVGRYDHSRELVIDPTFSYLTYLGGAGTDNIGSTTGIYPSGLTNPTQALAVDGSGNVYVTGSTYSTNFPVQNALQSSSHVSPNSLTAFVTKLNATGTGAVYSTYLGGTSGDWASAVAIDASGSAYVVGTTYSTDFPVTAGAFMTSCTGWTSCSYFGTWAGFVTKLSPNGTSLVYSTYLAGTTAHNDISAVAVDSQGRAYVAGVTGAFCDTTYMPANACFPETSNAVLPQALYDRRFTANAYNQGSAYLAVFNSTGSALVYSTLFGDSNTPLNDQTNSAFPVNATGVAVDSAGNFYLAGSTRDYHLPTTSGAFQSSTGPGAVRGYVAKFAAITGVGTGGTLLYATYLGGIDPTIGSDQIGGIAVDAAGSAYVTGLTVSPDFPVTAGAYQTSCAAPCHGGFVSKIVPNGSALSWSTYFGAGYSPATAGLIRLDGQGNVYIAGEGSTGNGSWPQVNPVQSNPGGNGQAFIAKFDPLGKTLYFSSLVGSGGVSGTQWAAGLDIDHNGTIYLAGNTNAGGLPVTSGAFQSTYQGGSADGFIAKINPFVASSTSLLITPSSASVGQTITFTATVSGQGALSPTGTVNFTNGAALLGSGVLNAGVATFSSSTVPAGSYSVVATYLGDNSNSGSASTAQSLVISGGGTPQLTWSLNGISVKSPGVLYVDLKVTNTGTGLAVNPTVSKLSLRAISGAGTPAVDVTSPALPIALGSIAASASTTVRLVIDAPATLTRFTITETGTVADIANRVYQYSAAEVVSQ